MPRKITVLFLCTGNSCRSIMSEGILRHRYGDVFDAYSAGTAPKGIHPMTVQVLDEIGVETNGLRSKGVKEYLGRLSVRYLVAVCRPATESCPQMFPGMVEHMTWEADDPLTDQGADEEKLAKFREVRDTISAMIDEWVKELSTTGRT